MQIIDKSAEGLKREFNVVVTAAAIEQKMVARLAEVGQQVRLPGFRPGKVPMNILRKRFGQSVMGEILERTIDESTQAAISEKALKPALQPKVELVNFEEGKDLEFSVAVEVLPEIAASDFSSLELERLEADVTDEELDKAIADLLASSRTAEPIKDDRKAEMGDVLVVNFVGRIDGKPFDGGSAQGSQIELGAKRFIPGFEEQLVGAKAGDLVNVKVAFPADYRAENLAGKDAEFEVHVKEIRVFVTPELNEDFARKIGRESVDDVKNATREMLQREHDGLSRLRIKRQLLDTLSDMFDFSVPEGMVDAEFDAIWRQIEHAKEHGQLDPDDEGKSDEVLREEYRGIAARRVRLGLLLSDVGNKNGIVVGSEDLSRAIAAEASRYPGQEQVVVNYYQRNPQAIEQLRAPMLEEKVVDFIIGQAKVTAKKVSIEELSKDPDDAGGHVHGPDCDHDHDDGKPKASGKKGGKKKA